MNIMLQHIGWGLQDEQVPFRMAIGKSTGDGKTDVVEEVAIRDELAEGQVSVRRQKV